VTKMLFVPSQNKREDFLASSPCTEHCIPLNV